MSSGYSANQYENAFRSQRLQNWSQTKHFKERPSAKLGQTSFIVDDRGRLLPGKKRRDASWSDFKGTWELPSRIPAPSVCLTARSQQGLTRLTTWGFITPRPDTTPGGATHTEGNTDQGRSSRQKEQQEEQKEEDANTRPTPSPPQDRPGTCAGERQGTPTPKPPAKGRRSAAAAEDQVKMCE